MILEAPITDCGRGIIPVSPNATAVAMTFIYAIIGFFIAGPCLYWLLERPLLPSGRPPPPGPLGRAIPCRYLNSPHDHYTVAAVRQCHREQRVREREEQAEDTRKAYLAARRQVDWDKVRELEDELGMAHVPETENLPDGPVEVVPHPRKPGYRVTDGRTGEIVGYWKPPS